MEKEREKMTREQAQANLKAIGIDEPTKEQIDNYLNQLNGETKREKDRADKYKSDADKMVELQKQLDEIQNKNLSDIEKAQAENVKANEQIAQLQKDIRSMENKAKLAELGIIGEQAQTLIGDDGSLDFNILGQIITEREQKASALKEKEILENTPDPRQHQDDGIKKTEADVIAETIGKTFAESNKVATDILSQYTN